MNCRIPPKRPGWQKLWKEYGVLATSTQQRKALLNRDGGRCSRCGNYHQSVTDPHGQPIYKLEWHAEHTYPLHLVDRTKWPGCLKYWTLPYLETIGPSCHASKTKREAKARAKVKRIAAKPKLRKIVPRVAGVFY